MSLDLNNFLYKTPQQIAESYPHYKKCYTKHEWLLLFIESNKKNEIGLSLKQMVDAVSEIGNIFGYRGEEQENEFGEVCP